MKLQYLEINGYKNLTEHSKFDFSNCSNNAALIGLNGSGKSNVLEALSIIFASLYLEKDVSEWNDGDSFEYSVIYELDGNTIKLTNGDLIITHVGDSEENIVRQDKSPYLPKEIISCYSGEELRMWDEIYFEFYVDYCNGIKKGNYLQQKLTYINKYCWEIALITLLSSDDNNILNPLQELIGIENINSVSIQFKFNAKKYKNYETNPVIEFIDEVNPDRKEELTEDLVTIKLNRVINREQDEKKKLVNLFRFLYVASMPKDNKLISSIKLQLGHIDLKNISEGEKKIILITLIEKVLADKSSLVLLDEPDSHVHLERKSEVLELASVGDQFTLFTTHSPTLCRKCDPDSVISIDNGKTHQASTALEAAQFLVDRKDVLKLLFSSKDLIIVEGKTDDLYIRKALEHFQPEFPDIDVEFLRAGGTDGDNIKSLLEKIEPNPLRKILVLVDRDQGGDNVHKSLFPTSNTSRRDIQIKKYDDNIIFLMAPHSNPDNQAGDFLIENYFGNELVRELSKTYIDSKFDDTQSFNKFPSVKEKVKKDLLPEKCRNSVPEEMTGFKLLLEKIDEALKL